MQEEKRRKTATSAEVTNRYRMKTYATFRFMVRFDDQLYEILRGYEGNLSALIRKLLAQHFEAEAR